MSILIQYAISLFLVLFTVLLVVYIGLEIWEGVHRFYDEF